MRILIFSLMFLFALYGTSFADMMPVKSFEDRTPEPFKNNPFGLVYGGAITENVSGKVNIHPSYLRAQRNKNRCERLHTCGL